MKHIRIRSMQDLKIAREVYKYESKISNQSVSVEISRFRSNFRTALENTLRDAAQKAIIFGLQKLAKKNK